MTASNADTIFGDTSINCGVTCTAKCRILHCLKYYNKLNLENENDRNKLVQFYDTIYRGILDDFIHIATEHTDDIDDIYDMIKNNDTNSVGICDINQCKCTSRHNRNKRKDRYETNNGDVVDKLKYTFIRDLFDTIHCYILHQYDFGYRVHKNDKIENKTDGDDDNVSCKDNIFEHISEIIKSKKKILENVHRFKDNNKYIIKKVNENDIKNEIHSEITMLDKFIELLSNTAKHQQLTKFLDDEQFDSDAVQQDIMGHDSASNIVQQLEDKEDINTMKQFITGCLRSERAFSTGFIFYYWEHYKHPKEETEDIDEDTWNVNDHGGYTAVQLYITKKYNSLKSEILNNKIYALTIEEYKVSLLKATEYIDKTITKSMKSSTKEEVELHYGIAAGTPLTKSNLLSIIFYTDWSELCTEFSKTFRKNKLYESLSSIKSRNREYANWSRILRETVEYHAYDGHYFYKKKDGKKIYPMTGPFYCGISCVMVIPEFNIRLCGPTSTSKQKEVATRFGGDEGMIIQLNNNGDIRSKYLRAFNCSWLSTYTGEDEWLFIGGNQRIKLETVTNVVTAENFSVSFQALFHFDCMINGTAFDSTNTPIIKDKDHRILNNLIDHQLSENKEQYKYPKYIHKVFESFISNKTQIVINLHQIEVYFQSLRDLIMKISSEKIITPRNSKKSHRTRNSWLKKSKQRKSNVFENIMFNQTVFRIFPNVTHIIIYSTDHNGWKEYKFDLYKLLSVIQRSSSRLCQVTIKAAHPEFNDKHSWIQQAFSKSSNIEIQGKMWNLNFIEKTDPIYSYRQDCLIITKQSQ